MFKPVYIIFALLASVAFLWLSYIGPPPPVVHQNIYLPHLESQPTFLLGNLSYRAFDKPAEQLWDDLVPANNGAVIATNITSGFHLWAIPAMFHQLRCLRDIRTYFIVTSLSWTKAQRFMSERGPGSSYDNVAYCFNYIRQVYVPSPETYYYCPICGLWSMSLTKAIQRAFSAMPIQPSTQSHGLQLT
ncbi:hypothetical protein DL98DRAFT_612111 [Cadophora sp. DSE1049]|nr:hypothetical protein DL98DRAFT_612111 [Cadophora sp. DSE1049]